MCLVCHMFVLVSQKCWAGPPPLRRTTNPHANAERKNNCVLILMEIQEGLGVGVQHLEEKLSQLLPHHVTQCCVQGQRTPIHWWRSATKSHTPCLANRSIPVSGSHTWLMRWCCCSLHLNSSAHCCSSGTVPPLSVWSDPRIPLRIMPDHAEIWYTSFKDHSHQDLSRTLKQLNQCAEGKNDS